VEAFGVCNTSGNKTFRNDTNFTFGAQRGAAFVHRCGDDSRKIVRKNDDDIFDDVESSDTDYMYSQSRLRRVSRQNMFSHMLLRSQSNNIGRRIESSMFDKIEKSSRSCLKADRTDDCYETSDNDDHTGHVDSSQFGDHLENNNQHKQISFCDDVAPREFPNSNSVDYRNRVKNSLLNNTDSDGSVTLTSGLRFVQDINDGITDDDLRLQMMYDDADKYASTDVCLSMMSKHDVSRVDNDVFNTEHFESNIERPTLLKQLYALVTNDDHSHKALASLRSRRDMFLNQNVDDVEHVRCDQNGNESHIPRRMMLPQRQPNIRHCQDDQTKQGFFVHRTKTKSMDVDCDVLVDGQ